jgi:hypothetical protein
MKVVPCWIPSGRFAALLIGLDRGGESLGQCPASPDYSVVKDHEGQAERIALPVIGKLV